LPENHAGLSPGRLELFDYAQRAGSMFGVEDLSIFLYSLVKMHKPALMVELGSGSGACSLLCAQAAAENGIGKVVSFDNGTQWRKIRTDPRLRPYAVDTSGTYQQFLHSLARRFSVSERIEYIETHFPPFPDLQDIDLLFIDYRDGIEVISSLLAHFMLRMSASASIFYDGGSSSAQSFLFLEKLVQDLNGNKLPEIIRRYAASQDIGAWLQFLHTRRFTLMHLTRQRRTQNSTSWIRLEPVDYVPHPPTETLPAACLSEDAVAHRAQIERIQKRLMDNPAQGELERLLMQLDVLERLERVVDGDEDLAYSRPTEAD
jgi:hypothetical protein